MQLKPLFNRIIVRQCTQDEKTAGGIIIPGIAKDRPCRGTVVSVGPGEIKPNGSLRPITSVQPGDQVLYSKYAGTGLKDRETGDDLVIIDNKSILAITGRAGG